LEAPVDEVAQFVGEHVHGWVRPYGDAAHRVYEFDRFTGREQLGREEGRPTIGDVEGKRLGDGADVPGLHERTGKVRTADRAVACSLEDVLVRDVDPEVGELADHSGHP